MRVLILLALLVGAKKHKKPAPDVAAGTKCETTKEIATSGGAIKLIPAGALVKVATVSADTLEVETAAGSATVKKRPFLAACKP